MRTTFTITLDKELSDFIQQQPGIIDPSAWINKLIHDDMRNQNISVSLQSTPQQNDDVIQELDISMDAQIPAAG